MVGAEIITNNLEQIYGLVLLGVVLLGAIKKNALKLAFDMDRDGDIDLKDVRKVVNEFRITDLVKVTDTMKNIDSKYFEPVYNIGTMSEADAKSFTAAMLELADTSAKDRDTVLKLIVNGKVADLDFIFEEVDIEAVKALTIAFKQLNMTSFLTAKDATPEMKERLYQVVKTAMSKNTSDLNALQKVLV